MNGAGAASSSGAGAKTKNFAGTRMRVVKVAKGAASGGNAPANPYAAGRPITIKDVPLYASASTGKVSRKISGTYSLYDGQDFGGRYRVTPHADMVGKKPVGSNVTGYINKRDIR